MPSCRAPPTSARCMHLFAVVSIAKMCPPRPTEVPSHEYCRCITVALVRIQMHPSVQCIPVYKLYFTSTYSESSACPVHEAMVQRRPRAPSSTRTLARARESRREFPYGSALSLYRLWRARRVRVFLSYPRALNTLYSVVLRLAKSGALGSKLHIFIPLL